MSHSRPDRPGLPSLAGPGVPRGRPPRSQDDPDLYLIQAGCEFLFLGGVMQHGSTMLHCLRELADVPYHLQPEATGGVGIAPDGRRAMVRNRLHCRCAAVRLPRLLA